MSRPKAVYTSMDLVSVEPSTHSSPAVSINPDCHTIEGMNPGHSFPVGRSVLLETDPVTSLVAKETQVDRVGVFVSKGAVELFGKPTFLGSGGVVRGAIEEAHRRNNKSYNINSAVTTSIRNRMSSVKDVGKPSSGVAPSQGYLSPPKPQSAPSLTKPSKPALAPKRKSWGDLDGEQFYDNHRLVKGLSGITVGARMNKKKRNRMK